MTISSTTVKNSYSGDGSTTTFSYTFKIFAESDLQVIIRSSTGIETTKTITTHYTITGVGASGGGSVIFTAGNIPSATETVVLRRNVPQTQSIDYIANDPFPAESHEEGLDRSMMVAQQIQEELGRAIKLSKTNTMTSTEFTTSASNRANKVFAFDSTGELSIAQELGTFKGNWSAGVSYVVRDLVKDTSTNNIFIATVAHTSSGSQPLTTNVDSAKWTLIVDAASASSSSTAAAASAAAAAASASAASTSASNASTSASNASTSASNASTSASNASTSATAAQNAKTAAETAFDDFDDRYLGSKASDPALDNDGNALIDGALYFDTTNNVLKVYDLGNAVFRRTTPTSAEQTNIDTVSAQISPTNNISTVAGANTNIGLVAGQISPTNNISTVASANTNIGLVAGQISPTNNISTVASANTNIGLVAGQISPTNNISTVAGAVSSGNIATVASNIAGVNSFAERYRVQAGDPSTSLDAGDLAFNTSANLLKFYDGSNWITITSGGAGITDVVQDGTPQLGGNLDVNGFSVVSTSNANINITPNGTGSVVLDGISYPQADGTANQVLKTNGSGVLSFTTLQGGNITTEGDYFSNYNAITANVTTTVAATVNAFLSGPITVNSGITWTIASGSELRVL